jgi:hypothetical protein
MHRPRIFSAARASRSGPAAVVVARRGKAPPLAPSPCVGARFPTLAAVLTVGDRLLGKIKQLSAERNIQPLREAFSK